MHNEEHLEKNGMQAKTQRSSNNHLKCSKFKKKNRDLRAFKIKIEKAFKIRTISKAAGHRQEGIKPGGCEKKVMKRGKTNLPPSKGLVSGTKSELFMKFLARCFCIWNVLPEICGACVCATWPQRKQRARILTLPLAS